MPNTTNYSFPTPADTDLVKNGADAIRDLGDAVDTAMNTALGTKKAGLVLLNTTSFSAVSSQSFNDVFSATYTNYKIVLNINTSSVLTNVFFRYRVSGADNSTGNYYYMFNGYSHTGGAVPFTATGATQHNLGQKDGGTAMNSELNIYNPFSSTVRSNISGSMTTGNTTVFYTGAWGGAFNSATSFTGFTLIGESGTLTGTVSIYGVNK